MWGECKFKYGLRVWDNVPTPGSRQAFEMSAEICGIDLEDFDLYLTPDGSTYEYMDEICARRKKATEINGSGTLTHHQILHKRRYEFDQTEHSHMGDHSG